MPLIRQNHPDTQCPVVLVGNKIDLVEYSTIDVRDQCILNECLVNNVCFVGHLRNYGRVFGNRNLYRMFSQNIEEYIRNVLLRTKGCTPSYIADIFSRKS